jgi:hypothetical protein
MPEQAPPAVYPGPHGYPMLPDLDRMNLGMQDEKLLMRRFLAAKSSECAIAELHVRLTRTQNSILWGCDTQIHRH